MNKVLSYLNEILTLLGEERRKLPALVVLFLFASLFDLVGLGLIAPFISLVLNPSKVDSIFYDQIINLFEVKPNWEYLILILGLGLVLVFLFKAIGNLWIQYRIISFSKRQQIRLQTYLMNSYQNMPYQVYLNRNSSEFVHSIQHLVINYCTVVQILLKCFSDLLIAFMIILVLAWQSVLILTLLIGLMTGLIVLYDRYFQKTLHEYGKRNIVANHQIVQSLNEGIHGLKEIRILGKKSFFFNKLKDGSKQTTYYMLRQNMLNLVPGYLMEFILVAFVVLVLSFGVFLDANLNDIIPTMGVFGIAALRLKPTATNLASGLIKVRFFRDTIRRLTEDIKSVKSMESRKIITLNNKKQIIPFQKLILNQVSFAYNGTSQLALKNISLRIKEGETIGIIGTSGSGKTTLVDVLLGLMEPQSGSMILNGKPLLKNLAEWHSHVSYLPQQVFLIDNSLRCNVALGETESEIDESRLQEALRQARLSELVKQLPQGVNTILGERGVRLSGGQRQRVALARAFYHGRSVLVMDEATSALDNETEKEIVNEIQRLKGHKTMIVIAHRLTTVQHCDRIYRLEKGQIVEEGTPEQVINIAN